MPCPLLLAPRKRIEQKPNNLFLLFLRLARSFRRKSQHGGGPTFELPETPGAIIIATNDAASSSGSILARRGRN